MLSNQQGILISYEVHEELHYESGRDPVTSWTQTIRRPADRPIKSRVDTRDEWMDNPTSDRTWSFFDHDDDIICTPTDRYNIAI